jgi:peptide/nickel transport system substrate-binding protein
MTDLSLQRTVARLVDDVLSGHITRRELMLRAAALGIAVPGVLLSRAAPDIAAAPRAAAPRAQDATPKAGGSLRAIIVDDPNFLDPLVTQLAQVRQTMTSVYDTLTYLDAADPAFPIKGRLASEWTFTEPTKFDMILHEGVTFHGGQDFTAEDVKWTIDYVLNPDTKSPNATFLSQVESVEVLEPYVVRFNLSRPWAAMPADLSTIQIYTKESTKESIETTPNGTGPFMWTEWVPGDHITLTRNPDYFIPDRPYLDEIVFRPIKEKATSLSVMEAGDADVFFTPEVKEKATIEGNPALKLVASLLPDEGHVLYVNNSRPPMSDQNIRLAASYALDRRTFHSAFLGNYGEKNTSPWTTAHWAYNPINDDAFEYDLERSRGYLSEAGYTDGKAADGTQLSINLVYPKGYPEWQQGSEMFQAAMAELGVEVVVEQLELATWIQRIVTTDEYDLSWDFHQSRSADPAYTLALAFFYPPGPQNITRYEDETLGNLIDQGGEELDQETRKEIYYQFQERWNELQPGLVVGEYALFHATAADVMGFATDPLMFQDFREVWLDR